MYGANSSIQFNFEKNQEQITFLDVEVYKQIKLNQPDQYTFQTKTHIKTTNIQFYVRQDSYHPPGTGKGLTIGETIRYLRIPRTFQKCYYNTNKTSLEEATQM